MKDSRINYKAKRPKGYDGFDNERTHHVNSRSKMQQKSKEVKTIDRAIRTKDLRALLEQDVD
jgi:hypothetical protein